MNIQSWTEFGTLSEEAAGRAHAIVRGREGDKKERTWRPTGKVRYRPVVMPESEDAGKWASFVDETEATRALRVVGKTLGANTGIRRELTGKSGKQLERVIVRLAELENNISRTESEMDRLRDEMRMSMTVLSSMVLALDREANAALERSRL